MLFTLNAPGKDSHDQSVQRSMIDAANAVHLTRSALTRSLHNLEEILGLALFERKKNGMQPTDFCLNMLAQSEKVLLAIKDMQRDAELECNIEQGKFNLAANTAGVFLEVPQY